MAESSPPKIHYSTLTAPLFTSQHKDVIWSIPRSKNLKQREYLGKPSVSTMSRAAWEDTSWSVRYWTVSFVSFIRLLYTIYCRIMYPYLECFMPLHAATSESMNAMLLVMIKTSGRVTSGWPLCWVWEGGKRRVKRVEPPQFSMSFRICLQFALS